MARKTTRPEWPATTTTRDDDGYGDDQVATAPTQRIKRGPFLDRRLDWPAATATPREIQQADDYERAIMDAEFRNVPPPAPPVATPAPAPKATRVVRRYRNADMATTTLRYFVNRANGQHVIVRENPADYPDCYRHNNV